MAGRGPKAKPKAQRRRRNKPERGEWKPAPGAGWQHGKIPPAPSKLLKASRDAWTTWMRAWWAAHWSPDDLPALRQVIRLYDQVERGEFQRATELRLAMDTFGITPKGRQDRRWTQPAQPEQQQPAAKQDPGGRYAHLRIVADP